MVGDGMEHSEAARIDHAAFLCGREKKLYMDLSIHGVHDWRMTAPDALIVGCGVAGMSIARELALQGANVVAIDRCEPGTQASPRAAGQSVSAQVDPAIGTLMRRSMDRIARFADETGVPFPFHRVGSVKYACSEWAAGVIEREVGRAAAEGTRVEVVSLERAGELAPHTDPANAVAAWHSPDDLYFQPPDMVAAFRRAAEDVGVRFVIGPEVAEVTGTGVRTIGGERIASGVVVVAAGAWTAGLLERSGVPPLPLTFVRHQATLRSGIPGIHPALPSVRVIDESVYARPDGDRLLFGTYEPRPLEFAAGGIPGRSDQVPLDPAPIEEARRRVESLFRGLAGSVVTEIRGAVVTMTPDRGYLVDEAQPGLYFFTGCNVLGLSTAPAIGEDIAHWIVSGERPATLAGFGLARFDALPAEEVRRRALAQYERTYRDEQTVDRVRHHGEAAPRVGQ
jgi:4-methylaminobutanoate oxidase (formaldehyde-forming)